EQVCSFAHNGHALGAPHISAIGFYGYGKKLKSRKPMISGWKDGGDGDSAKGGGLPAAAETPDR
ncbi:MAG: hypothetical protein WBW07_08325, partial [Azonexus sp.]